MALQALNEKVVWKEFLHIEYIKYKMLSQVQLKPTNSPFLKGHIWVKDELVEDP
jgi:hypothetical protein